MQLVLAAAVVGYGSFPCSEVIYVPALACQMVHPILPVTDTVDCTLEQEKTSPNAKNKINFFIVISLYL